MSYGTLVLVNVVWTKSSEEATKISPLVTRPNSLSVLFVGAKLDSNFSPSQGLRYDGLCTVT